MKKLTERELKYLYVLLKKEKVESANKLCKDRIVDLSGKSLSVDLSKLDLGFLKLRINFRESSFSYSNFRGSSFSNSDFCNSDFSYE